MFGQLRTIMKNGRRITAKKRRRITKKKERRMERERSKLGSRLFHLLLIR